MIGARLINNKLVLSQLSFDVIKTYEVFKTSQVLRWAKNVTRQNKND